MTSRVLLLSAVVLGAVVAAAWLVSSVSIVIDRRLNEKAVALAMKRCAAAHAEMGLETKWSDTFGCLARRGEAWERFNP